MKEEINAAEIREALDSIREIKKTLKSNMLVLRPYLFDKKYALLSALLGLAAAAFSVVLYMMAGKWGGFAAVPLAFKIGLFAFAALAIVALGVFKYRLFFRLLKKDNPAMNVRLFFTLPELRFLTVDALFVFFATLAVALALAKNFGSHRVMLPVIYLFVGYEYFQFAALFSLNSYRFIGVYAFILAVLSALINSPDPILWTGGTLASFFFAFALMIFAAQGREGKNGYTEKTAGGKDE